MATRQYLVPGGYYADEEGRRTYHIAGFGYQSEDNVNTYNETLHEDLTADAFLGFTFSETLAESLTAGFSYASTLRYYMASVANGYYAQEDGPPAYLIPGLGYYNTTSSRNYPVAPAFNTANIALSESLTANFSPANTQAFANAFPTLMRSPDLITVTGQLGGGAYGQMSFGTTSFGSPAVSRFSRSDRMNFGADYHIVMLAPDLPESTTVQPIGYYGGMPFGVTSFGGLFDASQRVSAWESIDFDIQLAETFRIVDTLTTDQSVIIPPPAANIFASGSTRTHIAEKTPAEAETYMIDWAADLSGDQIVSSSWRYAPGDLTVLSSKADSSKTTIELTGGTIDLEYVVTNTIMTANGAVREHSFRLFIEQYDFI